MSLMTFSIVGLICITCSALILSNNRISDLEYKNEKLKEENLGLIELIKSNTLEEVSYIVENTKTEEAFYNYLKENNYKSFPNRIKNISGIDLKNTSIEIAYNEKFSTKKFIHYKISVKSKIDNHEKYNFVKMKIENPYFGISEEDVETENINSNETAKSEEEISPEKNNENVNINESDLITFYNYEEE